MTPLNHVLPKVSAEISDCYRAARSIGFNPGEDTLTDVLLISLGRRTSTIVRRLSRPEEHQLGPDFLWAIERPSGFWLTLWVQAKKATGLAFLKYAELGKDPEAREQADRLIANADAVNAVPVYAFYHPPETPFERGHLLSMGACTRDQLRVGDPPPGGIAATGTTTGGVTLADACQVRDRAITNDPVERRAVEVNRFALPIECLTCTARVANPDPTVPDPTDGDSGLHSGLVGSGTQAAQAQVTAGVTAAAPEWVAGLRAEQTARDNPDEVSWRQLRLDIESPPAYFVATQLD